MVAMDSAQHRQVNERTLKLSTNRLTDIEQVQSAKKSFTFRWRWNNKTILKI